MQNREGAGFAEFIGANGERGVHVVCAAGPEGVAAAALLAKAFARARVRHVGTTVLAFGERVDSPAVRRWLADAPSLLLVGLGARATVGEMPQLALDGDAEPLAAHAFRRCEELIAFGDASWCAAVGLVGRAEPHVLIERALGRHARGELAAIAALLDGGARGPEPALESLNAVEMLAAAPDPRRFLASVPAEVLRQTQALVAAEASRAARVRPRAGFGVLVVEYESACRIEDLVAERWRGLRPGTVVLVANHGAVAGAVAVTARCAVREAVDFRLGRLRYTLDDEGTTLLDPDTWAQLKERLGVPPPVEHGAGVTHGLSALPN